VLKNPLHSPHLAPSHCCLPGQLKDTLRNHHFSTNQEVKEAMYAWLVIQPKMFLLMTYRSLWTTGLSVLEKDVDYTENDATVHTQFNLIENCGYFLPHPHML
jgi:hypothetical protein